VAGIDELGQRELVEAAGAAVCEALDGDDVADERGGQGEPAEPQAGSKSLAGGAGVGDPLGGECLEVAPWRRSAWQISPSPWVKPEQMTMRSGVS
jgi:hypothetical protein